MTTVQMSGPDLELEIRLVSKLGKRERRVIARSFLRQIRPWLKHFSTNALDHAGHGAIVSRRSLERGVRVFQSRPITQSSGRIGYEIRMKRLELGITQVQLAQELGILRSHLSGIERGLHLPRRSTRAAIEKTLGLRWQTEEESQKEEAGLEEERLEAERLKGGGHP